MNDSEHVDGRVARGIRTRQAIVEAHTDLVREGVLQPTAQLVAERAGVSVRTIWTNFADLETLLLATTQRWLDLDAEIWEPVEPGVPMDARIHLFCARRAIRMEHLWPAAQASVLGEPYSPALQRSRKEHVQRLRDDLEYTFGADIGSRAENSSVHNQLYVISTWDVWKMLITDLEMSRDQALRSTTSAFRWVLRDFL